jgi:lysophospholipase L1-like esterase
MGAQVTTNNVGYRSDEVSLDKPSGRTRVMMLGDSVLFGWGVKQDETVSARLQAAWRSAGRDIEVINTGVGNYNTIMEVEQFLTRGYKFKPDVVILNYFINDAEPVPRYDVGWLERISAARVYFGSRVDVIERLLGYRQQTDWQQYYHGLYDEARNPGGWRGVREAVSKLAAYCKQNGIRLLIVHYPEIRILQPYPFKREEQLLAVLAQEQNVPYLDLLDSVKDQKPSDLWVTPPDPHPNGRAHGLFARALRQWIDARGLLP